MDEPSSATKTRSERPGWSVIFRHPLLRDARGNPGLKIRRELNTVDEAHADKIVVQLNTLLADRSWWSVARRDEAEREFAAEVVSAFFDGMEIHRVDTKQLRDDRIPLPGHDEGYVRVMLVGTTGAGKTTLLRHLIGTRHEHDRFPSTSTAKTTISDTEIVTAGGTFAAVVTFMSESEVRAHIDECIEAACLAVVGGHTDAKVAAALLTHREQRFRLAYILGEWESEASLDESDFSFDTVMPAASGGPNDEDSVTDDERRANGEQVKNYVDRVRALATETARKNATDLNPFASQSTPDDQAAWLELYSDRLPECGDFEQLALDIRDTIESKFDLLRVGNLERSATGWPVLWTFETEDREAFLRQVRWFSSNHFCRFGRLLTPLVDGVRVRGPFRPLSRELQIADRLVLLDGQGLGHTAESASSVSTNVTKRFADVDLILLVDSAKQPLQAAPLALLRAAASAGYAGRLALAFTNFDQVKGDNLQTLARRRSHVMDSVTNAISGLRQLLGAPVSAALERRFEKAVFMFGALDQEIERIPSGVINELRRLLTLLQSAAEPEKPAEAAPIYSIGGLELPLGDAVESFLRPWEARLGRISRNGISAEHWTRVKALSRRFANAWGDEYDNLRPASDLIGSLQEEISRWLDSPAGWTRAPLDDGERMAALDPVRSAVFTALHDLIKGRLANEHRNDWKAAYGYSGCGSGSRRAHAIWQIYEDSAPPIGLDMKPEPRAFVSRVVGIVRAAVERSGGHFEVPNAA